MIDNIHEDSFIFMATIKSILCTALQIKLQQNKVELQRRSLFDSVLANGSWPAKVTAHLLYFTESYQ